MVHRVVVCVYSEYGDVNQNGLPNSFEILWFGKFGGMSTAGCCPDPNALTPSGKTLLECYREQIDPTKELKPREQVRSGKQNSAETFLGFPE